MDIAEVTAFLYALKPSGIRFGLESTRLVLERLARPDRRFDAIHLAGSNGKGSTAAFLESILMKAGLRVGLYSSPHLVEFRERFRVDGQPVDDALVAEQAERMLLDGLELQPAEIALWLRRDRVIDRMQAQSWYRERGGASRFCGLTFFEASTVLACLIFARAGVELALMECGMGGRLDATNVLAPRLAVVTPVQLEHTAYLGDTLSAIAAEKAGIIKARTPTVCARQSHDARRVLEHLARERRAPFFLAGRDFAADGSWREARFRAGGERIGPVRLGLVGPHQLLNAETAVGCLPQLGWLAGRLGPERIARGLESASWPGRLERFGARGEWILDGAHNPDGVRALVAALGDLLGGKKPIVVFGVLADKQVEPMLDALVPLASRLVLVRPADARGRDPAELAGHLARAGAPFSLGGSVADALRGLHPVPGDSCVVVTGSLTVVGEARAWLLAGVGAGQGAA
ncbi:MAG: bifunctional folylpolyglutamate synthase/dihydrofolate synthase [Deltaproteobacteria bacterium]|nr:bifunctional folylpolyglutamate synthase/dihydrofolate synthase [Deltaproteobacteria bacterium]